MSVSGKAALAWNEKALLTAQVIVGAEAQWLPGSKRVHTIGRRNIAGLNQTRGENVPWAQ
jgi:hypothetical protein